MIIENVALIYNIIHFIENKHKIELHEYQKKTISEMLKMNKVSLPRACGRSTVVNGICDYFEENPKILAKFYISNLRNTHSKHVTPWESDVGVMTKKEYENLVLSRVPKTDFEEFKEEYICQFFRESK